MLSKLHLKQPLVWVLGFFAIFLIGGMSGVMLASVAIDQQVHDSFFVVAHLHYVLIGGAIFPLFAAFYFWFPKWTGRLLSERLGWWNFGLMFIGFNMTFFPMHTLGLYGMPRRLYTYLPQSDWGDLNLLATVGAFMLGVGGLLFVINVLWSRKYGAIAGDNPWQAATLEWMTSSPPPSYNFLHLPTVQGRYPAWENPPDSPVVVGLVTKYREVLITTVDDAIPDHRYHMAKDSLAPLCLAVVTGLTFSGFIFHPLSIPCGIVATFVVLLVWFWPGHEPKPLSEEEPRQHVDATPLVTE